MWRYIRSLKVYSDRILQTGSKCVCFKSKWKYIGWKIWSGLQICPQRKAILKCSKVWKEYLVETSSTDVNGRNSFEIFEMICLHQNFFSSNLSTQPLQDSWFWDDKYKNLDNNLLMGSSEGSIQLHILLPWLWWVTWWLAVSWVVEV